MSKAIAAHETREKSSYLVDDRSQHTTDVGEDGDLLARSRKLGAKQPGQMEKDVAARDHLDDGRVGRSRRADARQSPRRVDNARRIVVGPFDDGNQQVDEAEDALLRRPPVADGVNERPQSVAAGLRRSARRLQSGLNDVKEHANVGFRRSSLVLKHVTQQSKCALIDLTATNINTKTTSFHCFH